MSSKKQERILCLISGGLFATKKHHKPIARWHRVKFQGWFFNGFNFWFGGFFGLPDRGLVC